MNDFFVAIIFKIRIEERIYETHESDFIFFGDGDLFSGLPK